MGGQRLSLLFGSGTLRSVTIALGFSFCPSYRHQWNVYGAAFNRFLSGCYSAHGIAVSVGSATFTKMVWGWPTLSWLRAAGRSLKPSVSGCGYAATFQVQFGHEEQTPPIPWGMLGNDQVGDCVVAGGAHEHMLWSLMGGKPLTFRTEDVFKDFTAITGLPPSPLVGADMERAANFRLKTGLLGADGKRHKIASYLEITPGSLKELYAAMYLFGAVGIALHLPSTAEQQFSNHKSWHIVGGGYWLGYHYVPAIALREGNIVVVTWGRFQAMRPSFYVANCVQAIVYLSDEALTGGKSLEGFDRHALIADMHMLRQ